MKFFSFVEFLNNLLKISGNLNLLAVKLMIININLRQKRVLKKNSNITTKQRHEIIIIIMIIIIIVNNLRAILANEFLLLF